MLSLNTVRSFSPSFRVSSPLLSGPNLGRLTSLRLHSSSSPAANKSSNKKGNDDDKITKRIEDYSQWYSDVIKHGSLAQSSPTRGSMIIKPWGMSIWQFLQRDLDSRISDQGVENAYFPLLIPKSFLSKEAEHVDGFAKECAVVTHHRLKDVGGELVPDPEAELEEPLIIRPTSETIIWSTFSTWISSHRDLPLKINQWANVMRWELRTRPFLRTSEFLWQEGHTAYADEKGAHDDARTMVGVYNNFVEDMLAMPTIVGVKSPSERFAGAVETYTIEGIMQNGWALQTGTSHYLGQSFGKAFGVTFQGKEGGVKPVYGSSWGVTTRMIGAMIMTHSDDSGLVLPPTIAPKQVVVVPIPAKKNDEEGKEKLEKALEELVKGLEGEGLRVQVDDRDWVRNGAKYFEWERKGVPLRIELGPRDVGNDVCVLKWRTWKSDKESVPLSSVASQVKLQMGEYQSHLLETAKERMASQINLEAGYEEMRDTLSKDEAGQYPGAGLYLVPWKCNTENEKKIKEECKATIRCYPVDVNEMKMFEGKKCFYSGEDADKMALFGRAF
ncbi:hypothetical protein TrVE_jg2756 [Triparma verrucosa]|uniref:proline--tRNA ligase n=1 Tax=Triparma verrucosa TaxID=1606542 RepID=A0A9W7CKE9_9STRA|nr:hypothetical protein TrVE_jg2756 [Triparma verrucosa]